MIQRTLSRLSPLTLFSGFILALALTSPACTAGSFLNRGPSDRVVAAESLVVRSIHLVITAEESAYTAKAFGLVQHQKNLLVLQKITVAEQGLNDALITWNASGGQAVPQAVATATAGLSQVLDDMTPLLGIHPTIPKLVAAIGTAISSLLTGVQ